MKNGGSNFFDANYNFRNNPYWISCGIFHRYGHSFYKWKIQEQKYLEKLSDSLCSIFWNKFDTEGFFQA